MLYFVYIKDHLHTEYHALTSSAEEIRINMRERGRRHEGDHDFWNQIPK